METALMGERGQVTIPKKIRDRLGLSAKAPVIFEICEEGLLIKPAQVVELRRLSDEQIKTLEEADRIDATERKALLEKWGA